MRRVVCATIALTFLAAAAAPAGAVGIQGIGAAAAAASRTAGFPVLAPTALPDGIVGGAGVRASLLHASSGTYEIRLAPAACASAACRFGFMRGTRPSNGRIPGRAVTFAGKPAYYVPGRCTNGCAESTLTWTTRRGRYEIGLRGANLSALVSTAYGVR